MGLLKLPPPCNAKYNASYEESNVLSIFAGSGANILTINQSIPTNGCAAVTISAETSEMEESLEQLLADVSALDGVVKLEILAG